MMPRYPDPSEPFEPHPPIMDWWNYGIEPDPATGWPKPPDVRGAACLGCSVRNLNGNPCAGCPVADRLSAERTADMLAPRHIPNLPKRSVWARLRDRFDPHAP